jgi:two-component system nitrate/nitrite response regulator NarL
MAERLVRVADRNGDEPPSTLEAQVRQLVSDIAAEDQPGAGSSLGRADSVIMDVQVDGVRYLLVRVLEAPGPLSPREREIARMVAKGYPNKTIASVLDISSWTVASHLRRVFSKLGVSSRAAMVARLVEDGSLADLGTDMHLQQDVATGRIHRPPQARMPP